MTLDCTCNRLKEAEAKAAKWDALVRCGECKFFCEGDMQYATDDWCMYLEVYVDPTDFCAWGERRES